MARTFLREGWRLGLRGLHLLGSRTVVALGLLLAVTIGIGAGRNLWMSFTGTTVDGLVVRQLEELAADWREGEPGPPGMTREGIQTAAAERVYRAVVEFRDGNTPYEVVANARATVHLYPLGTKVDVVFPPGKPERARLKPEMPDFWMQAGLLLIATLVGAGSGYAWWTLALRRAARRRVVKKAG